MTVYSRTILDSSDTSVEAPLVVVVVVVIIDVLVPLALAIVVVVVVVVVEDDSVANVSLLRGRGLQSIWVPLSYICIPSHDSLNALNTLYCSGPVTVTHLIEKACILCY
jgi:hypothetical protein